LGSSNKRPKKGRVGRKKIVHKGRKKNGEKGKRINLDGITGRKENEGSLNLNEVEDKRQQNI